MKQPIPEDIIPRKKSCHRRRIDRLGIATQLEISTDEFPIHAETFLEIFWKAVMFLQDDRPHSISWPCKILRVFLRSWERLDTNTMQGREPQ